MVLEGSPVVGQSLEEAGLRHLEGQYVTSVRRKGKVLHAIGSEFVLAAGDVLYLSGEAPSFPTVRKLSWPAQSACAASPQLGWTWGAGAAGLLHCWADPVCGSRSRRRRLGRFSPGNLRSALKLVGEGAQC